ncbi:MAG: hypothetical protein ABI548_25280 [Polyangiaceae bacterium]
MTPPFDMDVRDTDFAIVEEGRRRLQKSAPALSSAQVDAWLSEVRRNRGELRLTVDGLVACYPREAARG